VIDKPIEAELDAVRDENQAPNYIFQLTGTDPIEGSSRFVLKVTPKIAKKYLMRGPGWTRATRHRADGRKPGQKPVCVDRGYFIRRYEKHGAFWLPVSLESGIKDRDRGYQQFEDRVFELSN
jgi:hypothetical protein